MNETFLREVDEEYRRDKVRDFFVENRWVLISAIVLFLAAAGGSLWWRDHQAKKDAADVEQLATIYRDVAEGRMDQVPAKLEQLGKESDEAVQTTVTLTQAALDLQNGNSKAALAKYKALADDSSLAQPYRDIALIRSTSMEFDQLKPEEVIARMKPLAEAGSPWFGSAGEITALALIKQGKKAEAGRMFAAIARDKNVPETIRARSVQIASTLGVDASDAMPAAQ